MKWEAFECDDCKQRFALEQKPDDEIEEPLCPGCGGYYCGPVEVEIVEKSPEELEVVE
ncbi:hypothetical protein [Paenibacillus solani]|uniref:hypothetical protein n=1 Tax=Paenibacillus solani TaxID=1705565 RepID=UPI003D2DD552